MQSVPAGLHVRINLETGKKEAKILNATEEAKEEERRESIRDIDDDVVKGEEALR